MVWCAATCNSACSDSCGLPPLQGLMCTPLCPLWTMLMERFMIHIQVRTLEWLSG